VDEFPPGTVSTSQVTEVLELPLTEAAKVCRWPVVRPARLGLMLTVTLPGGGGAVMVKVADAVLLVSATDLADTVTVAGLGTEPGAVKVMEAPDALEEEESEPQEPPEQPEPVSVQVTPLLPESF
jgi:hypothetical protein